MEDERYWHPDGGGPDLPRTRYGFLSAEGGAGAGIEADRNVLLAIDWPRPVPRIG